MSTHPSDIAFTPAVKAQQERLGSRHIYENIRGAGWDTTITEKRAAFIRERDSFYLATTSADGYPYIQHRGGSKGVLRVLDEKRLAFADYPGNKQYISIGNLDENNRVCLFLMDYPNRSRLKIWGRAQYVEGDAELEAQVADPAIKAKIERVFVVTVDVMDGNCPKFIAPRFTEEEMGDSIEALKARIRELEEQVKGCAPDA
ncbi:MAG: pyridoxamine 5'-phosphate oxidase family protein [Planctomycetota bacterium]